MVILLLSCAGGPAAPDTSTGDSSVLDTDLTDWDRDGYTVGEDCDDTNPYVHPGAEEFCDNVDQDCDGEPLAAGVCATVAPMSAGIVGALSSPVDHGPIAPVPDLTGDGRPDLQTLSDYDFSSTVYSLDVLTSPHEMPDGAAVLYDLDGGRCGMRPLSADLTGDGAADLVILDAVAGEIYGFYGPFASGTSLSYAEVDFRWYTIQGYGADSSMFGEFASVLGDIDGDGRVDITYNAFVALDESSVHHYDVLFGSDTPDPVYTQVQHDGGYGMVEIGDADGDGLDDLLAVGKMVAIVPTANIPRGGVVALDDIADAAWPLPDDAGNPEDTAWGRSGDTDDDGLAEIYIGLSGQKWEDGHIGQVFFFEAPFGAVRDFDDAVGSYVSDTENSGLGKRIEPIRHDGGGDPGALLVKESPAHLPRLAYLVPPDPPPALRTVITDGPSVAWSWWDSDGTEGFETDWYASQPIDLDGDGIADLGAFAEIRGIYGYIPGFIPPWDDATYW